MGNSYIRISIYLGLILWFASCGLIDDKSKKSIKATDKSFDMAEIRKQGKLRVSIDYNSTNYFVYKGKPMGYQLELLQELCNHLGVKLDVTVSNDVEKNFKELNSCNVDLIASNLAITNERSADVSFTEPHCYTRQVLVQRKSNSRVLSELTSHFSPLIRNQLELANKSIYVQKGSAFYYRLKNLANEIGDSINVIEIPDYESEQLIGLVAAGEIDYTVCDENVARINAYFYDNIDFETAISFPQKIGWAVRPNSPHLLEEVNIWLKGFKKSSKYERIYQKYFLNPRSVHLVDAGFNSLKGGDVSIFDPLIKSESASFKWDWRLIASLIYQESRFSPTAESWAGAKGLMQLMPETAEVFGVHDVNSPEENIRGGIKLLKWLDERMAIRIEDPTERIKFVLASYNVGIGHVLDAMQLATKNGKNPKIWDDNVDFYLLNKSKPEYFNDPVVKFGYCRGQEPYQYVKEIIERYEHYKNVMRQ